MPQRGRNADEASGRGGSDEGAGEDFAALWQRYRGQLYTLCLSFMRGNHADAEEAFGNASVLALAAFPARGGKLRNPRAWLHRLFHNACIDLYRKQRRQCEIGVADLDEMPWNDGTEMLPVVRSPQQSYLDRELDAQVHQAIQALPPRLRETAVMRFCRQFSYPEISFELRISEENVRKRVQQARAALRQRLADYLEGGRGQALRPPPPAAGASAGIRAPATWPAVRVAPSPARPVVRVVEVELPAGGVQSFVVVSADKGAGRDPNVRAAALARYLERHPGGGKKRLEMADALHAAGRWQEAIAEYRRVLTKKPFLLEVVLRLGETLHALGRDPEAAEVFASSLAAERREGVRQHLLGWMEVCRGRAWQAAAAFEHAAALRPGDAAPWRALGAFHAEQDRPVQAASAFDRALELGDHAALTLSHDALVMVGRVREAEQRAETALRFDPGNAVATSRVAQLRCLRGQLAGRQGRETRRLVQRAQRLAPAWPDGFDTIALYHLARGRWSEALAILRGFVADHPEHARGWMLYARGLRRCGHFADAGEAILRSLALDDSSAPALIQTCRILPLAGRSTEAQAAAEALVERFPESSRAWAAAATCLVTCRQAERACLLAEHALQLEPELAMAWFVYAHVLDRAGRRPEEVASAIEQGLRRLPAGEGTAQSAACTLRLAESYRLLGDGEAAARWAARAADAATDLMEHDLAAGLFLRAKALRAAGEMARALHAGHASLVHHLFEPARNEILQLLGDPRGVPSTR
jgi:RNA polymerase sigma factor (sigma-70 family)